MYVQQRRHGPGEWGKYRIWTRGKLLENCSNDFNCTGTEGDQGSPGVLEAFGILIMTLGGGTFVLSVPTILALCAARTIHKGLRIYLLNTLVSGLLISTVGIVSSLIALTVFSGAPPPPLLLCRFLLWAYNIASLARSLSVVGYSIMVLTVVRYGKRNMKAVYIILSLFSLWGLCVLLRTDYLVPQVYAVDFVDDAVCLPVQDDTIILQARLFFTAFGIILITVVPLVVSIAVPLIVLCYIKKHAVAGANYGRAVAKLGLFLVMGSFINSAGIIVISILVYLSIGANELIYFVYVIALFSLYPTPILIIIFLKPVRDKMKRFLMCKCLSNCPCTPRITARGEYQIPEEVCDSLIIQQHS